MAIDKEKIVIDLDTQLVEELNKFYPGAIDISEEELKEKKEEK